MLREGVIFNRLMYVLVVCCCLLLFVAFLYVCMYPPLHIDNVVRTLPVRRLLVSRLAATKGLSGSADFLPLVSVVGPMHAQRELLMS